MENTILKINDRESSKYNLKWLNIKSLLQKKSIFEKAINEIKVSTLSKYSSKFCDIYKEKIFTYLLIEKNKKLISNWPKEEINKINIKENNITVTNNLKDLYSGPSEDIIKFFFYFRDNNLGMIRLINLFPFERRKTLTKFLCHFFYDNFLSLNKEEEIISIIYLLLEEEINNLLSPLCRNFLKDSFLTFFLSELCNKYEIRNYLDLILYCLIKDVEDKNSFNCYLNIIYNSKKHYKYNQKENTFFKMNKQDDTFINYVDKSKMSKLGYILFNNKSNLTHSKRKSEIISFKNINPVKDKNNINKRYSIKNINEFLVLDDLQNDLQIKNYINKDFFFNINEHYFKSLLSSEKDEIMKSFYIKQIRILNSSKDKNIFTCHNYFKKMKYGNIISKLAIEQFNKMVEVINNFIDKLLNNLEKIEIIPYYIRIICKYIDILISKKFKNISKIQKNSLISSFLFRILIFPILENPDINNSLGDIIISLNTRGILQNIYFVLSYLIEGELFNSNDNIYFTIFNKFIINNYNRINKIIDNIINISSNFDTNKKELDFIQYKSICFNIDDFLLFYNTIHAHKDEIFKDNKYIEDIFNNITKNISSLYFNANYYYVIINDNYDKSIEKKEYKIVLNNNSKNEFEIYKKIKYAIIYVLENLKLTINLDNNLSTQKTFEIIDDYLYYYYKPDLESKKPPLNWYSHFIVKNLNLINIKYKENDFQLLYKEIELNLKNNLEDYKYMNDTLKINLISKLNLLEKIKEKYNNQLEKIKKTEMNIKSLIFIESQEIKICLMTGVEYNQLIKSEKKSIDKNLFIISFSNCCPHSKLILSEKEKKNIEKKYHCINIKQFCQRCNEHSKLILEEIKNFSFGKEYYKLKDLYKKKKINKKINNENTISTNSIKEILEVYMDIIKKKYENNNIIDNTQNEMINIIWNYILKSIYAPIKIEDQLSLDNIFKLRCLTLQNIVKPKNLDIPEEIMENNFINKIKENLKIIDELKTPGEILKQFEIFIESINSLYKFFLDIEIVEPDELLNTIIYFILITTPESIFFKTNFCKYFLDDEEMVGNIGISIAQIESSLLFINKLEANQIGISQQELNSQVNSE